MQIHSPAEICRLEIRPSSASVQTEVSAATFFRIGEQTPYVVFLDSIQSTTDGILCEHLSPSALLLSEHCDAAAVLPLLLNHFVKRSSLKSAIISSLIPDCEPLF